MQLVSKEKEGKKHKKSLKKKKKRRHSPSPEPHRWVDSLSLQYSVESVHVSIVFGGETALVCWAEVAPHKKATDTERIAQEVSAASMSVLGMFTSPVTPTDDSHGRPWSHQSR